MKTVVIVQARMTSTRLPGKVLLPLAGRPLLACLLERLARVRLADNIVVATTTNATDNPIVDLCTAMGVASFRGSEHDVLSRYAGAAAAHGADLVVRVTSDCPLLDPQLVDELIEHCRRNAGTLDYVSNMLEPSYPYGMAVEVMTMTALLAAAAQATRDDEREHVTPFIYRHPERFRLWSVRHATDLSHHRWTVDTPEDYELVGRIFASLHPLKPEFVMDDVLGLLRENSEWSRINQHVVQKTVAPCN